MKQWTPRCHSGLTNAYLKKKNKHPSTEKLCKFYDLTVLTHSEHFVFSRKKTTIIYSPHITVPLTFTVTLSALHYIH